MKGFLIIAMVLIAIACPFWFIAFLATFGHTVGVPVASLVALLTVLVGLSSYGLAYFLAENGR